MGNASIEERREIAARLRSGSGHGLLGLYSAVLGDDAKNRTAVLYKRLAELIDPGEDVSMSAYDLLPEEDREILWWVHSFDGGLDAVSARYREADYRRIELCSTLGIDTETGWSDAMAEMLRRLMPTGFEWTDAFADAVDFMDCVHDLLYTIDGDAHTSEEMVAEIVKRLMPRGYEWPRYIDTGELLKYGDAYIGNDGKNHRAWHIKFDSNANVQVSYDEDGNYLNGVAWDHFDKGERVRRHTAIASDGEPLERGETVWHKDGSEWYVEDLNGYGVQCFDGDKRRTIDPDQLTHQRPVLDADGEPCRIGDEVWDIHIGEHQVIEDITGTCGGYETLVVRLDSGERTTCDAVRVSHRKPVLDADGVLIKKYDTVWPVEGGGRLYVERVDVVSQTVTTRPFGLSTAADEMEFEPSQLTHTEPEPTDDWETIKEESQLYRCEYFDHMGCSCHDCPGGPSGSCRANMMIDIVRRCKALAEKGETE